MQRTAAPFGQQSVDRLPGIHVVTMLPDTTALVAEIRALLLAARSAANRQVNALQVLTNFEIGRRIVVHEQGGARRAEYGKAVLQQVSAELAAEFGRGYSTENLRLFRKFYLTYQHRQISQTPSGISLPLDAAEISQTPSGILPPAEIAEIWSRLSTPSSRPALPFRLAWSHYAFLVSVRDPAERAFYEIEAANGGWAIKDGPDPRRSGASLLELRPGRSPVGSDGGAGAHRRLP